MDNQQQQPVTPPTNDFLYRMDMANNNLPSEPEKKKPTGLIIGIVIGVISIIGIIVGVIMLNSKPETAPTPTQTADPGPEIDEEMVARNKLRASDLLVVSNAVKKYQATPEADGQLPGPYVAEWNTLLRIFVPQGVLDGADDTPYTIGAVCKFGEPCVDISSLTWENDAHKIFILYNADCKGKTKDNVIVSSTRLRRVAIFSIIEGDEFICATN
jgi:hypothetical protein